MIFAINCMSCKVYAGRLYMVVLWK